MPQSLQAAFESSEPIDDGGVEAAFDVQAQGEDTVKTATWVGGCFIYTNGGVYGSNYYHRALTLR